MGRLRRRSSHRRSRGGGGGCATHIVSPWVLVIFSQQLTQLLVVLFQQVQKAERFDVRGAVGGTRELGRGQIMFFAGGNRVGTLTLEGGVASVGLSLGRPVSRVAVGWGNSLRVVLPTGVRCLPASMAQSPS